MISNCGYGSSWICSAAMGTPTAKRNDMMTPCSKNPSNMNNNAENKYNSFAHFEQKNLTTTCSISSASPIPHSEDSCMYSPGWDDDPDLEVVRVCPPPVIDNEYQRRTIENTMELFRVKSLDVFNRTTNDDFIISECYPRLKTIDEALIGVTCKAIKDVARTSVEKIFNFIYRLTVSDEFLEDERWFDTLALCITLSLKLMLTREDTLQARKHQTITLLKNLHMQLFYCCKKKAINILATLIRVPILPNQLQVHMLAKLIRLNLQNISEDFPLTSTEYIVLVLSYKKMIQLTGNAKEFTNIVDEKFPDSVIPQFAVNFIEDRFTIVRNNFSSFLLSCPDTDMYLYKQFVKFKIDGYRKRTEYPTYDLTINSPDYVEYSQGNSNRKKIDAVECEISNQTRQNETDEYLRFMASTCTRRKYHPITVDQKCPCRSQKSIYIAFNNPSTSEVKPLQRSRSESPEVEIIETNDTLIVISDSEDESEPVASQSVSAVNLLPELKQISISNEKCEIAKDNSVNPNPEKTPPISRASAESDNVLNLCDLKSRHVERCDTELSEHSENVSVPESTNQNQSNEPSAELTLQSLDHPPGGDSSTNLENISINDLLDSTITSLDTSILSISANDSLSKYLKKTKFNEMENEELNIEPKTPSISDSMQNNISVVSDEIRSPISCHVSIATVATENQFQENTSSTESDLLDSSNEENSNFEVTKELETATVESVVFEERVDVTIVDITETNTPEISENSKMDVCETEAQVAEEKVEPEGKIDSEVEPGGKINSEVEPEGKIDSEVEPGGKINSVVEPEGKIDSEVEPGGKINSEVEPEGKIDSEVVPKEKINSEVELEGKIDSEVEPKEKIDSEVEPKGKIDFEVELEEKICELVKENLLAKFGFSKVVDKSNISESICETEETILEEKVVSEIEPNLVVYKVLQESIAEPESSEVINKCNRPESFCETAETISDPKVTEVSVEETIPQSAVEPEVTNFNSESKTIELIVSDDEKLEVSTSEVEINTSETTDLEITEVIPSDQIEISEINVPVPLEGYESKIVEPIVVNSSELDENISKPTDIHGLDPITNPEAVLDALLKQHAEGTLTLNETKHDYDDDTNFQEEIPQENTISPTENSTQNEDDSNDVNNCVDDIFKDSLVSTDNDNATTMASGIKILSEEIIVHATDVDDSVENVEIAEEKENPTPDVEDVEECQIKIIDTSEELMEQSEAPPTQPICAAAAPCSDLVDKAPADAEKSDAENHNASKSSPELITKGALKEFSDDIVEIDKSAAKFKTKILTKKMKMLNKNGVSVNLVSNKQDDNLCENDENVAEVKSRCNKRIPDSTECVVVSKKAKIITDVTNSNSGVSVVKVDDKRSEIGQVNQPEKQELKDERIDNIPKKIKSTRFESLEEVSEINSVKNSIQTKLVPIYNGFKSKKNKRSRDSEQSSGSDEGATVGEEARLKRICYEKNGENLIPKVISNITFSKSESELDSSLEVSVSLIKPSKPKNGKTVRFKDPEKKHTPRVYSPPPYDLQTIINEPISNRKLDSSKVSAQLLEFSGLIELEKAKESMGVLPSLSFSRSTPTKQIQTTYKPGLNGMASKNRITNPHFTPNVNIKATPLLYPPTPEFHFEQLLSNLDSYNNSLVPCSKKESANDKKVRQNKTQQSSTKSVETYANLTIPINPPLPKVPPPPQPPPPPADYDDHYVRQSPPLVPENNSEIINLTRENSNEHFNPKKQDWRGLSLIRDVSLNYAKIKPFKENEVHKIESNVENTQKPPIVDRKRNENKCSNNLEKRVSPIIIRNRTIRKVNSKDDVNKQKESNSVYKLKSHNDTVYLQNSTQKEIRVVSKHDKCKTEYDRDKNGTVPRRTILRKTEDINNWNALLGCKPKNDVNYLNNHLYSPISDSDETFLDESYENTTSNDIKDVDMNVLDLKDAGDNVLTPSSGEALKSGDSNNSTSPPISETEGEIDLFDTFMNTGDNTLQYSNMHSSIGTDNDILCFGADDNYGDIITMEMPDATGKNGIEIVQQTTNKTGVLNNRDPCLGQLDDFVTETATKLHNL